jgi:hypothetical protein
LEESATKPLITEREKSEMTPSLLFVQPSAAGMTSAPDEFPAASADAATALLCILCVCAYYFSKQGLSG